MLFRSCERTRLAAVETTKVEVAQALVEANKLRGNAKKNSTKKHEVG